MKEHQIDPRHHTAEHILHGVVQSKFRGILRDLRFKGNKTRCDFKVNLEISLEEFARILEEEANKVVAQDQEVVFQEVSREEALQRCKAPRLPKEASRVRLSLIGEEIIIPCAGEHVRTTGEVGKIVIRTISQITGDKIRLTFSLEDLEGRDDL